jgi:hypothetical protein
MTIRKTDLSWTEKHRYVVAPGGLPQPSVTTILQTQNKPALLKKAVSLTREGVDHQAEWDAKADIGTRVHRAAETLANGVFGWDMGCLPCDVPYLDALEDFYTTNAVQPILIEPTLVYPHPMLGFGGRCDLIARLCTNYGRWETWLIDYKTGKHYMVDPVMQLAAYANCDMAIYYEDGSLQGSVNLPTIQKRGIVYLNENRTYNLIEVPQDKYIFNTFLNLRSVYAGVKAIEKWERTYNREHA